MFAKFLKIQNRDRSKHREGSCRVRHFYKEPYSPKEGIPMDVCQAASSCTSIPYCATPISFSYSKNTLLNIPDYIIRKSPKLASGFCNPEVFLWLHNPEANLMYRKDFWIM